MSKPALSHLMPASLLAMPKDILAHNSRLEDAQHPVQSQGRSALPRRTDSGRAPIAAQLERAKTPEKPSNQNHHSLKHQLNPRMTLHEPSINERGSLLSDSLFQTPYLSICAVHVGPFLIYTDAAACLLLTTSFRPIFLPSP